MGYMLQVTRHAHTYLHYKSLLYFSQLPGTETCNLCLLEACSLKPVTCNSHLSTYLQPSYFFQFEQHFFQPVLWYTNCHGTK